MLIAILITFALGFGAGRVHHISSLMAKIAKLETGGISAEQAGVQKVKALVKFF